VTTRKKPTPRSKKPKARESYHHGALREELIKAAQQIVETEGVDALSVREVARRAGVSSAAPFRHFADKQALMAAVATDALRSFVEHTEKAMEEAGTDPVDRFRAVGIAYIDFALAHPARFRAMCDPVLIHVETPELTELRERSMKATRGAVEEGMRLGLTPGADVDSVLLAGQALAYGLARMFIDGMLPLPKVQARAAAIAAIDVLGTGVDPNRVGRQR
jgi:AcrR family transcriptional regulator